MSRSNPTSRRFPFGQTAKDVGHGYLVAIGILPLERVPAGAYWARDSLGRWELRVPAYDRDKPPK
jgi:hypothetical protein